MKIHMICTSEGVADDGLLQRSWLSQRTFFVVFNPLNAELNPICHLLALLGAHHILHVSRIRVNLIKPGVQAAAGIIACLTCQAYDFA